MIGVALLETVAARLVEASLVGGALALLAWALCHFVPALPPALRCWLWWGVALKMVAGLLPLPAVELPLLPGRHEVAELAAAGAAVARPAVVALPGVPALPSPHPAGAPPAPAFPWPSMLVALWLAGAAVALARGLVEVLGARRVVRAARPATDPSLVAAFDTLRRRLGVPNAELRLSSAVTTPQAVGAQRPVVLLPAAMAGRLSAEELAMAIGHELLHVRRGDLLLGLVPALAARCLFFHPLARLVEREYALSREEACDAAVVASLAPSPRAYGRLLLELALGCGAPLRAAAAAVTHPTLQRRLQMLLRPARPFRPALGWSLLFLGLAALVPLRLTARVAVSGEAPAPTRAPQPAAEQTDSFVYFRGDGEHSMDGSRDDFAHARRFQREDQPMIWMRRGGQEWVIDDPGLLARADALWEPVRRLGAQQAELGSRQAALGAQQAALGAQQAELGQGQAQLAALRAEHAGHMARLAAEQSRLALLEHEAGEAQRADLDAHRHALESKREELDRLARDLSRRQQELGRRQEALGERQAALGARQGGLGEEQGALGSRQHRAAEEAHRLVEELVDEAIRGGQARRVD